MLKPVSAHEVILAQSGYTAQMFAVSHRDVLSVLNSFNDEISQTEDLYELVYRRIYKTNISPSDDGTPGKPKYDQWLKVTAHTDLDTLLYGVYCATYPEKSIISVICGNCGTAQEFEVSNTDLRHPPHKPANAVEYMKQEHKIKSNALDPNYYLKLTKLGENNRIHLQMNSSKLVFSIGVPSMYDYLWHMQQIEPYKREKYRPDFELSSYVHFVLVPVNGVYNKITDCSTILEIIMELSITDYKIISDTVKDNITSKLVRYEVLEPPPCRRDSCKAIISSVPLDINNMIFHSRDRLLPLLFSTDTPDEVSKKHKAYTEGRRAIEEVKNKNFRQLLDNLEDIKGLSLSDVIDQEIPLIDSIIIAKAGKVSEIAKAENANRTSQQNNNQKK